MDQGGRGGKAGGAGPTATPDRAGRVGPAAAASGIEAALRALVRGEPVIVLDGTDREDEGDLVLAAAGATPEWLAFMIRHTSGILCVPMTDERADALALPLMVADNTDRHRTAFTVSVDLIEGTTTGISAADRCATVRALADPASRPEWFARPGPVFPLRARPGGVLERPGHTEAAVELAHLAGLPPVMVIGELMCPDGRVADRAEIARFAAAHQLVTVTIAELVAYRRAGGTGVTEVAQAAMPTRHGRFRARLLRTADGVEHLALVRGELHGEVLVRVHAECHAGDAFGSLGCDCGDQLDTALAEIDRAGAGVLLYQFGRADRGNNLATVLRAHTRRDPDPTGTDQARSAVGRDLQVVPRLLRALGVTQVCLLTSDPDELAVVRRGGYPHARRRPLVTRHRGVRHRSTTTGRNEPIAGTEARVPALAEVR